MDLERKQIQQVIEEGKAVLGIELGSTRIKAVSMKMADRSHLEVMIGKTDMRMAFGLIIWKIFGKV